MTAAAVRVGQMRPDIERRGGVLVGCTSVPSQQLLLAAHQAQTVGRARTAADANMSNSLLENRDCWHVVRRVSAHDLPAAKLQNSMCLSPQQQILLLPAVKIHQA